FRDVLAANQEQLVLVERRAEARDLAVAERRPQVEAAHLRSEPRRERDELHLAHSRPDRARGAGPGAPRGAAGGPARPPPRCGPRRALRWPPARAGRRPPAPRTRPRPPGSPRGARRRLRG